MLWRTKFLFEFLVVYSCILATFTLFTKRSGFEMLDSQFEAQRHSNCHPTSPILADKLFSKIKHFLRNCKFCRNQTCPW